ncbi:MAG: cyclic-di-AMP receptor [Sphaerochaetaceae bacterium]|jgi:uncharacterized protein YaaQ
MKLILAIVYAADESDTVAELTKAGFFVTKLSTVGGFLQTKSTTLLVGTDDEKVEAAIDIIRKFAGRRMELRPASPSNSGASFVVPNLVDSPVGGSTVFVMDIERFEKL